MSRSSLLSRRAARPARSPCPVSRAASPGDRIGGRFLNRRQQPLVRFRQPRRDGFGGGIPLRLRLSDLMGRQVERFSLGEDRLPGQVVANRLVQVLKPRQVRGQKDERVAVEPRRGSPGFEDGGGRRLRGGSGVAAVRMVDAEHDQAGLPLVRHVVSGPRRGMDAAEPAGFVQRGAQPDPDRLRHAIRVAAQLLGAVLGQLRDRRSCVVPVAGTVLVEVGGPGGQPPEGVPEDGGRFARQHAAELDAPVFDSALRGPGRRRRPEIDGAGDAPAG